MCDTVVIVICELCEGKMCNNNQPDRGNPFDADD